MDKDAAVGKDEPLALGSAGEQHRPHRRGHADTVGGHIRADELHRVVDRQPRRHAAARGVDVEIDVGVGVVVAEEQQLGDHEVGQFVVDGAGDEHDTVAQQPAVDVVAALAAAALFDHDGNQMLSFRHVRISSRAVTCLRVWPLPRFRRSARTPAPLSGSCIDRVRCLRSHGRRPCRIGPPAVRSSGAWL